MVLSRIFDRGFLSKREQRRLVLKSDLFDPNWYAAEQELVGGTKKALSHFLELNGAFDPSIRFSSGAYLADNPDVRDAGLNPLLHYLRFGTSEGRVARDRYGQITGARENISKPTSTRVRRLFDEVFYRDANPDLIGKEGLFEHFMRAGWRQGRDPAPWFSIEAYQLDHADIIGTNPFLHYALKGKTEGRSVRISRQPRLTQRWPNKEKSLRIAVVAMVRNEADIIKMFASHLLALFDDIIIVDHQSSDGTAEFLAALARHFSQIQLLSLREPSYIQSVTMTHIIRDSPRLRNADWIFLLDADEFLPFQTKAEFQTALRGYQGCPVISMPWHNITPVQLENDAGDITLATEYHLPPALSTLKKTAFQPSKVAIDRIVVAQGNHALTETLNGIELRSFGARFHLFHIPVRSVAQLGRKLEQGIRSYQNMGEARDVEHGAHWYRMKQLLERHRLDEDQLLALALNYSEDSRFSTNGPGGTRRQRLRIASCPISLDVPAPSVEHAKELADKSRSAVALKTRQNGDLVRHAGRVAEYGVLPPDAVQFDLVRHANESLTEKGVQQTIPLIELTNLVKPRRYVEIGNPYPSGALTVARAAKDGRFECEIVSVCAKSLSSESSAQVPLKRFQFELFDYRETVSFMRMDARKAAFRFEESSIDMLALECDLDTEDLARTLMIWREKLSNRGVVYLRDASAQIAPLIRQSLSDWHVHDFPGAIVLIKKQVVAAIAS